MSLTGHCHCGAVVLTIPRAPEYINICNCTLCTSRGSDWGYFRPAEVSVSGALTRYLRQDTPKPALGTYFCPTCGTTTHWLPNGVQPFDRMGVNMRLFAPEVRAGVEVRLVDGLSRDV